MSTKTKIKGFLKMSLGLVLVAPSPVGLAVGIPITVIGNNDKNAAIEQFEASPEYAQAEQYREDILAYIAEFKPDYPVASEAVLDKEKEYLNADTSDEEGFMYSVLKESEYGEAYAMAKSRFDAGLATTLSCGLAGPIYTAAVALLVYDVTDDNQYFGAISRNLIAAGAVEAFGKDEEAE